MVHLGTNEDETKVFRAHAVPQGLFENMVNALKLVANQQRDGRTLLRACKKEAGHERVEKLH